MEYGKIVEQYGTPIFIFNKKNLKETYRKFDKEVSEYLKDYKIFFSVKTNSNKKVLKVLSEMGSGFEVASERELESVKDFNNEKIYNGPCKKRFVDGILYNVDSVSEMKKLAESGKNEIGIRVSFEEGKFGIESERILEAFKRAKEMGLIPKGISSHPGTQIRKIEEYKKYIGNLKEIAEELDKNGFNIEFIDVGGGFPDKYSRKSSQNQLSKYFEILTRLNDYRIYLEPGRALVSESLELITRVEYIKKKNGNKYAICNAGINLIPKITLSRYKFEKISDSKGENERYILAGPLLFGNDILHKSWNGHLEEGDYIKIKNVGAYCLELAWRLSYDIPDLVEI
ncbi:MAG: hypothetical protein ABEK36_05475 [Candidatus Aenigmatarchaeota archaeon]